MSKAKGGRKTNERSNLFGKRGWLGREVGVV
jgi:hypothetical protein